MMFPRIALAIEPVGGAAADPAGLQATIRSLADELQDSRKRKAEGSEEPPRARAVPPGQHVPPGAAGEVPPGAVVDVPPGAAGEVPLGAVGPGDVPPGAAGEVPPGCGRAAGRCRPRASLTVTELAQAELWPASGGCLAQNRSRPLPASQLKRAAKC